MHKFKEIKWDYFLNNLFRIGVASVVMFVVLLSLKPFMTTNSFIVLILGAIVGGVVYITALTVLRVPIAIKMFQLIKK